MKPCKVTILRGAPGIGKSTWACRVAAEYTARRDNSVAIFSADDFFNTVEGYVFDASRLPEAHNRCLRSFLFAINYKVPRLIVDNTNTSAWEISPYLALGRLHDYEVEIIHFTFDPWKTSAPHHHLSVPYAASALAVTNTHGVPAASIEKMLYRLDESLPPSFPKQRVISRPL